MKIVIIIPVIISASKVIPKMIIKDMITSSVIRKVLYTAKNSQLVLMSLKPGEDIGEEIHQLDQFIRCEAGEGNAVLDGAAHHITDGFSIVVPAGAKHNNINTSSVKPLKLYTLYSPPNHHDGVIHKTKADDEGNEEHFDGVTTERINKNQALLLDSAG